MKLMGLEMGSYCCNKLCKLFLPRAGVTCSYTAHTAPVLNAMHTHLKEKKKALPSSPHYSDMFLFPIRLPKIDLPAAGYAYR